MNIVKAKPEDFSRIRFFYHSLIDAIQGLEYKPGWQKDIYPAPDDLKEEIESGCLYYGVLDDSEVPDDKASRAADGRIVAAMVVNQKCHEEYRNAHWKTDASPEEVMVIHMLGVHPDYARQGLAKEMVHFALNLAKDAGMKAMRLDVMKGNMPAEKLYPPLGFEYIETRPMFYEDVGTIDFELFERLV